jgi:DNA modification methylase
VAGLKVETWSIDRLIPYARNPRRNDEQVDRMASAIKEFGFRIPIVARSDGSLVDGHLRLKAAQKLGLKEVPVALADELTEAQVKAFRILANKSANWAEWEPDLLKLELEDLQEMDFDLELTGFELPELEDILGAGADGGTEGQTDPDAVPEAQKEPVSRLGDVWLLGRHRLMCGDSTDAGSVALLMNGEKADMVFTDPPYGVSYTEKNEFLNRRGKAMACPTPIQNDEMPPEQMHDFWVPAFKNLHEFTNERMCYYITAPQGGDLLLLQSVREAGFMLKHQLIWNKNNHVLGRCDYDYKHEPIVYGWKIGGTHKFYGGGQFKTSVWDIPKPMQSKLHPTMKPVELIENAVLDGSAEGQTVLDLFGGSGSTLIACEKTGRVCRMMELSSRYVDVIVRRWQEFTGQEATLEEDGRTFAQVKEERGG